MRIGFVCPYSFDEPGGVQAHILDLATKLIEQGHDVKVIGPCGPDTDVPDFVVRGGRSFPIRYNGSVARLSFGPRTFAKVKKFITDGDFDILHIHEPNSPSFSLAALMLAEGPIVATYHASAQGSILLKLALPILRPYLERIRGGIAVSEMARRWQVEQLGGDPVLIPNGVDIEFFAKHAASKTINVPEEPRTKPRIAFLGRIDEPRKGLDVLLKAHQLTDYLCDITVIGGGKGRRKMRGVYFAGRVDDDKKARLLGEADIYVAPNTGGESFGIVLVEAMAAGCAVIASDLEAFAAVCAADSETPAGLLFKTGDPQDLARAIEHVVNDPQLREQLVRAGAERCHNYDWDHVARSVLRVYETVSDGTKVKLAAKPESKWRQWAQ
ncbi:MAG: glycosyltransferase family 4 protein [Corynebacterium sp.]|uniref:glycosyltransferase family 4 protein n=1 Tax=Corynebacterium sp. TaxID=1720 RepID=UPI0026DC5965|nr:glycosyltransferase family 4 protein [Corynebacterium sp.]MDO5097833.1 glycosyltransferase family 4 protein [Corynebacterium sp.]